MGPSRPAGRLGERRRRGAAWAFLPVLGLALSACEEGAGGLGEKLLAGSKPDPLIAMRPPGPEDRLAMARPNRTRSGMREAPEVFAAAGEVLWDGMPTLEGLWVAHPDTTVAQRVRMRNPRTGTVIDGALLPRRDGAGTVVISAEAADALGLLPSVPAEVELVAIEPEPLAADRPGGSPDAVARVPYVPAAARRRLASFETGSAAVTGAEARVGSAEGAERSAVSAQPGHQPNERAAEAAAEGVEPASPVPQSQPSVPRLTAGRAAATAGREGERRSPVPQVMVAAGGVPYTVQPHGPAPATAGEATGRRPAAARPSPIEAAAEDRLQPAGATPGSAEREPEETDLAGPVEPAAETSPGGTGAEEESAAIDAPASAAEQAPQPPGGTPIADGKTHIQVGYFAVPEHAADLVRRLSARGVPVLSRKVTVRGISHNRVIAGPFASREALDEALRQVRALGIADARPFAG